LITLTSYVDLEKMLRDFQSWPPSTENAEYDVVGIGQLLVACLANLREHHIDADLEALATLLSDEDRLFLSRMIAARPSSD